MIDSLPAKKTLYDLQSQTGGRKGDEDGTLCGLLSSRPETLPG